MFTPLIFKPLYRQYLWGGRRFQSLLGRELEQPGPYAESWEIVDHGSDQSIVRYGPLAGKSLGELALSVALARKWISKDAVVIWEERSVVSPPRELNVIKSKYIGNSCINFLTRCD